MRVLVTGARGFVGSHTLRPLVEAQCEVHALSRELPSDHDPAVQWHRGDLLSPGTPREIVERVKPTHLLHLAWETTHGEYWTSPANVRWGDASRALAQAFLEQGGRRMVAAGTCAEYDWSDGVCDEETTPLRPATPYGAAKVALSHDLRAATEATNSSFAWARLFFVYGPGEQPQRLVPSVIAGLLRGDSVPCTAGHQRRDFLYVADCASALVRLLQSDVDGSFNIASGHAVPVREVVMTIARALDAEERVTLGALPDRPGDPPLIVGTNTRLQSLGWSPAYDLRAGIEETIRWRAQVA